MSTKRPSLSWGRAMGERVPLLRELLAARAYKRHVYPAVRHNMRGLRVRVSMRLVQRLYSEVRRYKHEAQHLG